VLHPYSVFLLLLLLLYFIQILQMERLLELQSIINWLLRERRTMNHRIDRQTHVIVSNAIHNSNLASTNRNLTHQNAYLSELFALHHC
jgi:hypothetical protein